jgi:hypothetical protein
MQMKTITVLSPVCSWISDTGAGCRDVLGPVWPLVLALTCAPVHALDDEAAASVGAMQQYVQGWLGTIEPDEAWRISDPETTERLSGDMSSLYYGGGASQMLWGDRAQVGFEGGGLVSWKNDRVAFFGQNGSVALFVDNSFFTLDVFMGGVVTLRPTPWLRLYAAAGPSIAWGYLDGDGDSGDDENSAVLSTTPGGALLIDLDDGDNDISFAVYGRAGIDIELTNGFTVGFSARYAGHEFNFDERGRLSLDEVQWFLTFGQRI